ncbi:TPA: ead/Ea22-like family protein [Escherichia coli]|nr:ead/Ea22-like family protein [Escherichia coli]HEI3668346.1 ead/Ea22-like family protein [Escherichia coli]HEI4213443.1 ead/Ea22-like family protein [Escherichia coli]
MSKIDYQALRELAKQATQGEWVAFISPGKYGTYAVHTPGDNHHGDIVDWPGFDEQKNAENNARYIAAFNPEVVQALLDERERNQQYIKRRDQENEEIALTVGKLRVELEAAEKRIAELEAEPVSQTCKLNEPSGNSPVTPDGWISRFEEMPDPSSEKRVCAFTPTNHEDMRYRFVPASLFKTVCRDATHWFYMLPPVGREEVAGG